ncbi:hypothetical protein PLESTB_000943200 [Pleodorina starrii]|uniref:Uncharacterized protein n=1 Tax=Pleodorina starrii TaxID=330485 RepID=A0A9W6F441_9CHLO|nr:hypothetical protein PLESTB_000943200 [Pleodorina starrii]
MPGEVEDCSAKGSPQQSLKLGLYLGAQHANGGRTSPTVKPQHGAAAGQGPGVGGPALRVRPGLPLGRTANADGAQKAAGTGYSGHGASAIITKPRLRSQSASAASSPAPTPPPPGGPEAAEAAGAAAAATGAAAAAAAAGANGAQPVPGSTGAPPGAKYDFSSAPRGVRHRTSFNGQISAAAPAPAAAAAAAAGGGSVSFSGATQAAAAASGASLTAAGAPSSPKAAVSGPRMQSPPAEAGRRVQGLMQGQGAVAALSAAPSAPSAGAGGAGGSPSSPRADRRPAWEEDPETQANVRKWYRVLQEFKSAAKDSLEFVYLCHARPEAANRSPYNLRLVQHAEVKASPATRNNHYTMSAKGVTHFVDGVGDFISLEQFEREYALYRQLLRFRMFAQYRLWKSFRVWRRFVSGRKARSAKAALQSCLLTLNPVFHLALVRLRTSCHELRQLRLHAAERGRLYSLPELVSLHTARKEETRTSLERFEQDVLTQAQEACSAAMHLMEMQLMGGKIAKFAPIAAAAAAADGGGGDGDFGAAGPWMPPTDTDAVSNITGHAGGGGGGGTSLLSYTTDAAGGEFGYALNAARRSYKRRIHAFVRLMDYMICDALHELLMDSTSDLLAALSPRPPPPPPPPALPAPDGSDGGGGAAADADRDAAAAAAAMDLAFCGLDELMQPAEWGVGDGQFLQLEVHLREGAAADAAAAATLTAVHCIRRRCSRPAAWQAPPPRGAPAAAAPPPQRRRRRRTAAATSAGTCC